MNAVVRVPACSIVGSLTQKEEEMNVVPRMPSHHNIRYLIVKEEEMVAVEGCQLRARSDFYSRKKRRWRQFQRCQVMAIRDL